MNDTRSEAELNEVAELAAAICGAPLGIVSLADGTLQCFHNEIKSADEIAKARQWCEQAMQQTHLLVGAVDQARLRFFAGMPVIAKDGRVLGALGATGHRSGTLTREQQIALKMLARQVSVALELQTAQAEKNVLAVRLEETEELFRTRSEELARYQSELEAANDSLRKLAVTDELTGLKNRRAFEERLAFEFSMARRKKRDLCVVLMDADDFKRVNDQLGHPAGDSVLQQLAKVLRETVRLTDLAVRFGGEEFAVILTESDERSGMLWCRRLQKALTAAPWEHHPLTVSMGVAGLTSACVDGGHLVALADQALYRAKRKGKNCFVGSVTGDAELAV